MTLKQLRYLLAIVESDLNISRAARALHISQVAISKQVRLLEEELSVKVFLRQGKKITAMTQAGHEIFSIAGKMTRDAENIKQITRDINGDTEGKMTIAATHTQTCYVLPRVMKQFLSRYPRVQIAIRQGAPTQCAEWVVSGKADLCVSTEVMEGFHELATVPCYRWNRCIITPLKHPLAGRRPLTLEEIARYPIISYDSILAADSKINRAFTARALRPSVLLTSLDSDAIKTYVRLGFGVGILSELAVSEERGGLKVLSAKHLFEPSITAIGIRRDNYIGRHMGYFIELFTTARSMPHGLKDA
jgi:LysR family transcriptional regulator, cys regulon transcriptional activator